jgi:histidine ammonia-lyase
MSGAEALSAAGLKPYQLKSKEGLSLLNGTPGATGLACLATYDAMEATKASEIMAAFSYETNKGNIKHLDPRLHSVKNHSEQQESAENILNLLKGSEISQKYEGYRMQDAYSLRCVAQMMGGTKRAIKEAYISVTEELNSCSDNPVIYPTGDGDGVALMGGNFDRAYLCIHMDALCIAMTHLGKLVERRTDRLTNRHFSDYPPFLVKNPGLNSGFMITQYTSAGLVAEMKVLSHPVSVDSIPTSANQEDPVSFGFYASRKACEVAKKLEYLNAIELMTQVQAMDFMEEGELKHSPVIQAVYDLVRAKVPTVEKDRHFYPDIMDINELLVSGKVIDCAEEISGKLKF